jgi:hypothetical protein
MTKQELYDALKARGVKLGRGVNFFTEEALQDIWDNLEAGEQNEDPKLCALEFDTAGWCPELNRAYNQGVYLPESLEEFNALKPYAAKELPR